LKVLIHTGEDLLKKNLTRWGYEVLSASDGNDALALLTQTDHPKLAILNYEMDGLCGADLCRRLRADSIDPYTYMILLMEKSQKDDLLEAFEQGADDYLVKPFDGYELRAKLLVANRILGLQDRLIAMRDELQVQATHDALTGLFNRGRVLEILAAEIARSERELRRLAVLMVDLDRFKQINDTLGHQAGDAVLREAARRMQAATRQYDAPGRYGGEEFLIVLPGCGAREGYAQAERIREAFAREPFAAGTDSLAVTCSIGVSSRDACAAGDADRLIREADAALYDAKNRGRNSVMAFVPAEPSAESLALTKLARFSEA